MADFKVIGTRVDRVDGVAKVTGQAAFGADIHLPGLLYGKILRSPHPRARITRIDTSRARQHPGVMAVLTGDDLPALPPGIATQLGDAAQLSERILSRGNVRWKGHPVAVVAAVSTQAAEEALQLITVDYEVLTPITDVLAAMSPDSPLVHDDLRTRLPGGKRADRPSNVAQHALFEKGNAEAGFAQADVVIEREYRTEHVHQGYIEPQSATAHMTPDGQITIWTCTQGHFRVREIVSTVLGLPLGSIRVVPMEVGGGFGGKSDVSVEPLAVALTRATGRPVKLTLTRAEVFEGTGPAYGSVARVKLGATRSGELLAGQIQIIYDSGCYGGMLMGHACHSAQGPYRIPNLKIEAFEVLTNKPRGHMYRGPGGPQANFALESTLDELCRELQVDPLEFRLRHAARAGDIDIDGQPHPRIGFVELLHAVKEHPHWQSPLPPGPGVGRGFAAGYWPGGGLMSGCTLTVNTDGSVNLNVGSVDLSGTRTTMAQIVAEELGITTDMVHTAVPDTASVPYTHVTVGSRTVFATGIVVHKAAVAVREELRRRAARLLEASESDVEWQDGAFRVRGVPSRSMTVPEVASRQLAGGSVVSVTCSGVPEEAPGAGVAAALCDVQVDPETGKVHILRFTCFQDVGRAIHPTFVEGQMQGGTVQGIGWALMEQYDFKDGVMRNPNLMDYKLPTALDVPNIETCFVEVPSPIHPYGARGVGEPPIIVPPAALANAIAAATGKRVRSLPMTPERIWRSLTSPA